jgi:hypothetical protein
MSNQEKEVEILNKVASGELSAEDGLRQLKALDTAVEAEIPSPSGGTVSSGFAAKPVAPVGVVPDMAAEPPAAPMPPTPPIPAVAPAAPLSPVAPAPAKRVAAQVEPDERELAHEIARWKRWWMIPFWVGVVITVAGAGLVYWGYTATHFGWGFWLAWPPFLLGLLVMILGWQSQKARWLHVRVRQKPGEKPGMIVISMPLPLRLAAWFLRVFGRYIPEVSGKGIDEILLALEQSVSADSPFYVNVEDESGEHVEVFIG